MGLLSRAKNKLQGAASKAASAATTGLKVVGGTGAKALGSKNTWQDFDRGLDKIIRGDVSKKDFNRAIDATGGFLSNAAPNLVQNVGDQVNKTVGAAGESLADIGGTAGQGIGNVVAETVENALSGLFGFGDPTGAGSKILRAGLIVGGVLIAGGVGIALVRSGGPAGVVRRVARRA